MTTATTAVRPAVAAPAACPICGLDRAAAIDEGMAIAAKLPQTRTPEERRQVADLLTLLDNCERQCGVRGGWPA